MQNVIINFSASGDGLQPAIAGLEKIEAKDKATAEQAKKSMEAYQKRDKAASDSATKTAQSVDKMAAAFKGLEKSIVGGAYTSVLANLQTELKKGAINFESLTKAAEKAEKELTKVKPGTKEYDAMTAAIKQANDALDKFIAQGIKEEQQYSTKVETEAKRRKKAREEELKKPADSKSGDGGIGDPIPAAVPEKVKTLTGQLRAMKNELSQLEEAGQEGSKAFEQLSIKAAQLEDQIGDTRARISALASDTANIDAVVQGTQLMASGFQLVTGAQALLGAENEDLQKGLVKLNAIMAVTAAIQQLQQGLQKENIVVIKAQALAEQFLNFVKTGSLRTQVQATAATEANTVATAAQTEATVATAAATTGAATAMQVLRAAILATGIGLLVVGLVMAVSALSDLISHAKEAAAAKRNFDAAMRDGGEYLDAFIRGLEETNQRRQSAMKAAGASDDALAEQQIYVGKRIKAEQERRLADLKRMYFDEQAIKRLSVEEYKALGDRIIAIEGEISQKETEIIEQTADRQRDSYLNSLKSQAEFAEARVLLVQRGSRAELAAQIDAIRAQEKAALLSNPNLTIGGRAKAVAEANARVKDLEAQFRISKLQSEKNFLDAVVARQKEGSAEQLKAKLAALEKQKQIDFAQQLKDVDDVRRRGGIIEKVEAEAYRAREQMLREFNERIATNTLNAQVAKTNTAISELQVAGAGETNTKLLALRERLVDEQATLEVLGIQRSVDTEENKRLRINAVYAKALVDKKALEDAKIQAEVAHAVAGANSNLDVEAAHIEEKLAVTRAGSSAARKLEDELFRNKVKHLENERAGEKLLLEQKVGDAQEHADRILEIDNQLEIARSAKRKDAAAKQLEIEAQVSEAVRSLAQASADALFSIDAARRQADLDATLEKFSREKEAELSNADLTQDQKNQINRKYAEKEKELKRSAALADRDAKKKQAAVNGFLAVTNALATMPFPAAYIAAAAAAAMAALQIAQINATPLPKFAKGGIAIKGPGTGTSDSIIARISAGESVITATQTAKHQEALRAINENRFQQYLIAHELPQLYANLTMPAAPQFVSQASAAPAPIDYDRLADSVAKALERNPQLNFTWDEQGARISMQKGNEITEYKNKKLNL